MRPVVTINTLTVSCSNFYYHSHHKIIINYLLEGPSVVKIPQSTEKSSWWHDCDGVYMKNLRSPVCMWEVNSDHREALPLLITANTPAAPVSIFPRVQTPARRGDAKIRIVLAFRDSFFKKLLSDYVLHPLRHLTVAYLRWWMINNSKRVMVQILHNFERTFLSGTSPGGLSFSC